MNHRKRWVRQRGVKRYGFIKAVIQAIVGMRKRKPTKQLKDGWLQAVWSCFYLSSTFCFFFLLGKCTLVTVPKQIDVDVDHFSFDVANQSAARRWRQQLTKDWKKKSVTLKSQRTVVIIIVLDEKIERNRKIQSSDDSESQLAKLRRRVWGISGGGWMDGWMEAPFWQLCSITAHDPEKAPSMKA